MSAQLEAMAPKIKAPGGKPGYLPQLDGLRGIAILTVLLHHFDVHLPAWVDCGPIGVRTFFLLSGYLITLSLWKLAARAADGESTWRGLMHFHWRRMVRLTPVLYLMIGVSALIGFSEYSEAIGWHLAFLTNFHILSLGHWPGAASHLWSLSAQEQFYVLWPFLILAVSKKTLPYVLSAFVLGALVFRFGCMATNASEFYRWTMLPGVFDSFALGALIACWKVSKNPLPLASGRLGMWLGLAALASYVIARFMRYASFQSPFLALTESFENVFLGWILLRTIAGWRGVVGKVFENPALVYIGKISYGIYVFHVLVHVTVGPVIKRLGLSGADHALSRAVLLSLITVGVATLSWRWIEQPLAVWVRKRESRPAGLAPEPPALPERPAAVND